MKILYRVVRGMRMLEKCSESGKTLKSESGVPHWMRWEMETRECPRSERDAAS